MTFKASFESRVAALWVVVAVAMMVAMLIGGGRNPGAASHATTAGQPAVSPRVIGQGKGGCAGACQIPRIATRPRSGGGGAIVRL